MFLLLSPPPCGFIDSECEGHIELRIYGMYGTLNLWEVWHSLCLVCTTVRMCGRYGTQNVWDVWDSEIIRGMALIMNKKYGNQTVQNLQHSEYMECMKI